VRPQTEPYYQVSRTPGSAYGDADVAQHSINKLQQLDAHPDIFICLAHDGILFDILPLFNDAPGCDINDWRSRCYKERSRWAFLNELPKGDKPGREPLVSGRKRGSKELAWEAGRGFFEAVDQPRM
ncbi:hypothetical protein IMZ48_07945, partial [Candidatus Bathyarchaeota archaeon]|nr:hypothetical protein [Candidatus Bathyarchaeota archaeon]